MRFHLKSLPLGRLKPEAFEGKCKTSSKTRQKPLPKIPAHFFPPLRTWSISRGVQEKESQCRELAEPQQGGNVWGDPKWVNSATSSFPGGNPWNGFHSWHGGKFWILCWEINSESPLKIKHGKPPVLCLFQRRIIGSSPTFPVFLFPFKIISKCPSPASQSSGIFSPGIFSSPLFPFTPLGLLSPSSLPLSPSHF